MSSGDFVLSKGKPKLHDLWKSVASAAILLNASHSMGNTHHCNPVRLAEASANNSQ